MNCSKSLINTNDSIDKINFEYINTSQFQGISDAGFRTDFSTGNSKKDSINQASSNLSIDLNYSTQNRIYFQNDIFFGIHENLYYTANPLNSHSGESNYKTQYHHFSIMPYISVGKGRVRAQDLKVGSFLILASNLLNKMILINPN